MDGHSGAASARALAPAQWSRAIAVGCRRHRRRHGCCLSASASALLLLLVLLLPEQFQRRVIIDASRVRKGSERDREGRPLGVREPGAELKTRLVGRSAGSLAYLAARASGAERGNYAGTAIASAIGRGRLILCGPARRAMLYPSDPRERTPLLCLFVPRCSAARAGGRGLARAAAIAGSVVLGGGGGGAVVVSLKRVDGGANNLAGCLMKP